MGKLRRRYNKKMRLFKQGLGLAKRARGAWGKKRR